MSEVCTTETLPAIVCTSWCEIGDGHPNEWHPDDQWCSGEVRSVALSRMPVVDSRRDRAVLYLAQMRDGSTHAHLERVGQGDVEFTLDELRELRDNATALLTTALLD